MEFKHKIKRSINFEEQRVFVKFSVLQDHSAGLIHLTLVKLLGSNAASKATVTRWAAKFKSGEFDEESHHGGDRSDQGLREQRVTQILDCLEQSEDWSVRSLASQTNIPHSTVQRIITHELVKISGKWVPRVSTETKNKPPKKNTLIRKKKNTSE